MKKKWGINKASLDSFYCVRRGLALCICCITGFVLLLLFITAVLMFPFSFQLFFPESPVARVFIQITGSGNAFGVYSLVLLCLTLLYKWSLEMVSSGRRSRGARSVVEFVEFWRIVGGGVALLGLVMIIFRETAFGGLPPKLVGFLMMVCGVPLMFRRKKEKKG